MKKIAVTSFLLLLSVLLFVSSADIRRSHAQAAVADLSITKADSPDPVNTGSNLTYTITVTNNGPDAAINASWSDTLPAGTTFVSLPAVGGWSCTTPDAGDTGTVSCSNPSFAVGSSVFTLTVAVDPTVPAASTLSNTATVTSSTSDGNMGNNSSTATTLVRSPSSLRGSKSRSGGGTPGSTLSYLIILSNDSGSDQQDNPGNEFTDVLPAGLTLVAASASGGTATANTGTNTVTWSGVVPGSDSITISIDATINNGTTGQTIANTGSIKYDADGNGTNEASASTNTDSFVVGAATLTADLGVTKSAPDALPADSDVTYTITVTNGGPDTATSATLNDPLQGNLTFVSLSQPAGWSCNSLTPGSGGTLTCSRDLPAGSGPQVFTLVTHIPSGTPDGTFYNNMATVSTTATDPTSENDVATAGTTVMCTTDGIVTTSADDGPGSLRRAIRDACAGGTITFDMTPGHVVSPITLTSAELLISKGLTIQGPGANLLTVARSSSGGTPNFRIFTINSGTTVTISGLTISNGRTADGVGTPGDFGGGIYNSGTLNLTTVVVSGNRTGNGTNGGVGGGVFNLATLTLTRSTISGNQTGDGSNGNGGAGGGIYNNTGSLTLIDTTVSGNQTGNGDIAHIGGSGGGMFSFLGTLTLINSTVGDNQTSSNGDGGGIYKGGTGTLTLTNSTISRNRAGNNGGGVFSTGGTSTLTNATVTDNRADNAGGGINVASGTVTLKNTIVAGNFKGASPSTITYDVSGMLDAAGSFNLIGDGTGMTGIANGSNGNQVGSVGSPINAMLGALASNGGSTQTHLPLPSSPAVNAGSNANLPADTFDLDSDSDTTETLSVDQRGIGFARIVYGTVDIGAVEVNYAISATAGTPQSAIINSSFATALKATVTESGNPQNGVPVTFTAPGSGASGTFPGSSATAVASTNSSGVATAPTFTANSTVGGPYNVVAGIGTGLPTATFALTNTKLPTMTGVTSSLNPSNLGQSVTFTATVTANGASLPTPSGTMQFKDGGTNLGLVTLNSSGAAQFTTSALTVGSHTITADYSGDGTFLPSTGTLSPDQVVNNRPLISLSQSVYNVNENANFVTITVNRSGDTTPAVTVDYATQDDSGPSSSPCVNGGGLASSRCDFISTFGTLRFAATETTKTFVVLITQDTLNEGQEMFTLALSNPTGGGAAFATPFNGTVMINDSVLASPPNAIDDSTIFVRQHYHDFLNREPDAGGLTFWTNEINSCGANAQCIEVKRINVSAAFFLSIEFQQSGGLVRNSYVAALDRPATNNMPAFVEFERDTQAVQRGVIFGQPGAQAQLDANRTAFLNDFVTRAEFVGLYPTTDTPGQYVDKLYLHAAIAPTPTERNNAIGEFGAAVTAADPGARGRVLQRVTQNTMFQQRELNPSFVQMEYFGYLRRNPNDPPDGNFTGYNFWLNKMNQFNGNFINAEMVKAFISSGEYRKRFGP